MTDASTAQILEAIEKMNTSTNISFGKVYNKIDEKFGECEERLNTVEKEQAVKAALCKERKAQKLLDEGKEKERTDYWQYVIRAISAAGAIALLIIAGKLILFGMKLP